MNGYQKILNRPVQNCLYPFFWQHGEEHTILGEYVQKIYESGMRALCIEARPHPDFVGEGWWKDMRFILSECKKRGMKIWILDDSHFPTGYVNGRIKADYPEYLKLYLDIRRFDVQGPLKGARIDLKILKGRIWEVLKEDVRVLGVYMARRAYPETEMGDPIDADTLTDITTQMRMEERLLTVDIPNGAYSIFTVFETRKGMETATADYLNPLIKEAAQVLIDEVYQPHYEHYREEFGKTITGFFSDEPRFGNAKGAECQIGKAMPLPWRPGMEKELPFELKYLPLLWTLAGGAEAAIRLAYMDLVTRLFNENFTKVLGGWCREHGVWYLGHTIEDNGAHTRLGYGTGHYFRGQQGMDIAGIDVIGGQIVPGMNYHHDAFNTGGSNGEFYHYALAKLASSAAHLEPQKEGRCMCEAFGAYGWNEGLKIMKWIADSLMVRGINHIVPHAFNPKAFPDADFPPHFYAHGNNPQFRYFPVLDDYMNRIMSLFREGHYPAKIGVFYPAEMEWAGKAMPVEKVARELTMSQIAFDIVSLDYLKHAEIGEGYYRIYKTKFEVLVFPYGRFLPADVGGVLSDMIRNGVKVIFVDSLPETLLGEVRAEDWENIKEGANVCPIVVLGQELCSYCPFTLSNKQRDLVIGEYEREGKQFYMFFNESLSETVETEVAFRKDGYIYRYDAFEDNLIKVSVRETDAANAASVYLSLASYESTVYIISQEPLAVEEKGENEEGGSEEKYEEILLDKHWTVRFADSLSYPAFGEVLPVNKAGYIHVIDGYDRKTGTARFSTQIEIGQVSRAVLELENAYEIVEVLLNQESVGVRICKPYCFDVSEYLRVGINELVIEVTNTLGTQVRDGCSHYLPIEPFGIEGQVRLLVKPGSRSFAYHTTNS